MNYFYARFYILDFLTIAGINFFINFIINYGNYIYKSFQKDYQNQRRRYHQPIIVLLNSTRSHNVQKSLQRTRFFTPAAVILTINTYSGSVPEAKHLTDIIKYYAAKNKYKQLNLVFLFTVLQKTSVWGQETFC